MSFEVRLEVFQGPFELLLGLITERRVDVCDVPIARLTEDYLAHLTKMEEFDLEVTTEFLVVAATLLQLKARALLPQPLSDDGEGEGERVERDLLVARLLEVRTFQAAGVQLAERLAHGDTFFPPRPAPDDEALRRLPALGDLDEADLARTLVGIIREQNAGVDTSLFVGEDVSLQAATSELLGRLGRGPVRFADLAREQSLSWTVAFFLALLELAMRGEVRLSGGERIGDIDISLAQGEERV